MNKGINTQRTVLDVFYSNLENGREAGFVLDGKFFILFDTIRYIREEVYSSVSASGVKVLETRLLLFTIDTTSPSDYTFSVPEDQINHFLAHYRNYLER